MLRRERFQLLILMLTGILLFSGCGTGKADPVSVNDPVSEAKQISDPQISKDGSEPILQIETENGSDSSQTMMGWKSDSEPEGWRGIIIRKTILTRVERADGSIDTRIDLAQDAEITGIKNDEADHNAKQYFFEEGTLNYDLSGCRTLNDVLMRITGSEGYDLSGELRIQKDSFLNGDPDVSVWGFQKEQEAERTLLNDLIGDARIIRSESACQLEEQYSDNRIPTVLTSLVQYRTSEGLITRTLELLITLEQENRDCSTCGCSHSNMSDCDLSCEGICGNGG